MEVTKDNFAEAAAEVEALLPTAAFIAIDEEMTGISIPGQAEKFEELPAERYTKVRKVACRYAIIQFGVAIFHKCDNATGAGGYVCRAFNFYVFPEAGDLTMEGSSIGFNRDHGMDWNKWIRQGIPYLSRQAAEQLEAKLLPKVDPGNTDSSKDTPRNKITLTKESDKEVTTKALDSFRNWLGDDSKREESEFEVLTTNGYLRRYLYETFAKDFPDIECESRSVEGKRGISTFVALRLTKAQQEERDAKIRAEKEKELAQKVGFTRIFRALGAAKKPLIGHNCMADLCFMFSHFESLPESYTDFKALVHGFFPQIFDTKMLATREPFKFVPEVALPNGEGKVTGRRTQRFGNTALGEVHKVFSSEAAAAKEAGRPCVEVTLAPGSERYGPGCDAYHEAGYDAYVTGYCFAHMAADAIEGTGTFNSAIPMFRGLFNYNLTGEDELVTRGIYVHVTGLTGKNEEQFKSSFVEITVPQDVAKGTADAEKPPPPLPARMDIRWVNVDSAFAIFPTECADRVAEFLKQTEGSKDGLTLQSFEAWRESREAGADVAATAMKRSASDGAEPVAKRAKL